MQKSDFTLKSHKQMRSPDGHVYSGHLMHKGQPVCEYYDGGYGGGMELRFASQQTEAEFNAFIKTLPPYDCSEMYDDGKVHTGEHSADTFIEEIIIDLEMQKKLKRMSKGATVFRLKGDAAGSWRKLNVAGAEGISYVQKSFGDKVETIFGQVSA